MTNVTNQRPDLDIQHDLERLEYGYPPLMSDRFHINFAVNAGHVTITGHVRTIPTYEYLLKAVNNIDGVQTVNIDKLYVDDHIRRATGKTVPAGMTVRIEYGTAILAGQIIDDARMADIIKQVNDVEGIKRVITSQR